MERTPFGDIIEDALREVRDGLEWREIGDEEAEAALADRVVVTGGIEDVIGKAEQAKARREIEKVLGGSRWSDRGIHTSVEKGRGMGGRREEGKAGKPGKGHGELICGMFIGKRFAEPFGERALTCVAFVYKVGDRLIFNIF